MKSREELLKGMDNQRALFGLLLALGNRLQATGDAFYDEITCKQLFFLICLALFQDEPPTLNDVAEVMSCSHQNAKQIALKLEKGGFIKIVPDKKDKRKLRILTTPKLEEMSQKYYARDLEFMKHFYEGIEDRDVETTYRVLCGMEANLIKIMEVTNENNSDIQQ